MRRAKKKRRKHGAGTEAGRQHAPPAPRQPEESESQRKARAADRIAAAERSVQAARAASQFIEALDASAEAALQELERNFRKTSNPVRALEFFHPVPKPRLLLLRLERYWSLIFQWGLTIPV